jgi:hypothetical protein
MSERRPGVPRLRHGAGVGVGHVCAEGTVHGPIVSLQPLACSPDPKFWHKRTQKQAMVHCRLGIPERRVGDGRRCACYGYAAAQWRRRSREYSFSCTQGCRSCVSRTALLHRQLPLSSGTTSMLDTLSHTHCCVHRTERVQQQSSATIILCVQWMQRSRNHSQSLCRPV